MLNKKNKDKNLYVRLCLTIPYKTMLSKPMPYKKTKGSEIYSEPCFKLLKINKTN